MHGDSGTSWFPGARRSSITFPEGTRWNKSANYICLLNLFESTNIAGEEGRTLGRSPFTARNWKGGFVPKGQKFIGTRLRGDLQLILLKTGLNRSDELREQTVITITQDWFLKRAATICCKMFGSCRWCEIPGMATIQCSLCFQMSIAYSEEHSVPEVRLRIYRCTLVNLVFFNGFISSSFVKYCFHKETQVCSPGGGNFKSRALCPDGGH